MQTQARQTVKFLNLFQVQYPIGAIASFGHRVSGVILVLTLPLMARALGQSLQSREGFEALFDLGGAPWLWPLIVVFAWAAAHHLCAGIRHMLMDIGIAVKLGQSRTSAGVVIALGVLCALFVAAWLLLG